jgi:hypothetical protein
MEDQFNAVAVQVAAGVREAARLRAASRDPATGGRSRRATALYDGRLADLFRLPGPGMRPGLLEMQRASLMAVSAASRSPRPVRYWAWSSRPRARWYGVLCSGAGSGIRCLYYRAPVPCSGRRRRLDDTD